MIAPENPDKLWFKLQILLLKEEHTQFCIKKYDGVKNMFLPSKPTKGTLLTFPIQGDKIQK